MAKAIGNFNQFLQYQEFLKYQAAAQKQEHSKGILETFNDGMEDVGDSIASLANNLAIKPIRIIASTALETTKSFIPNAYEFGLIGTSVALGWDAIADGGVKCVALSAAHGLVSDHGVFTSIKQQFKNCFNTKSWGDFISTSYWTSTSENIKNTTQKMFSNPSSTPENESILKNTWDFISSSVTDMVTNPIKHLNENILNNFAKAECANASGKVKIAALLGMVAIGVIGTRVSYTTIKSLLSNSYKHYFNPISEQKPTLEDLEQKIANLEQKLNETSTAQVEELEDEGVDIEDDEDEGIDVEDDKNDIFSNDQFEIILDTLKEANEVEDDE